jgi:uncharacterized protein (DUF2062 family)
VKTIPARFRASIAGMSPETIALILSVGLVLGVFPIFGLPTLLCAVAAFALRLNAPAIQLVNQLASPLQLALLIPLARIGGRILGGHSAWSVASGARDAIAGWFCLCVPLGLVAYFVISLTLRLSCQRWLNGVESPG